MPTAMDYGYCCTCAAPLPVPEPCGLIKSDTADHADQIHRVDRVDQLHQADPPPSFATLHRQLPCCDRVVCSDCLRKNARFATYCPYCQIATAPPPPLPPSASSTKPSSSPPPSVPPRPYVGVLPPGLRAPPPYSDSWRGQGRPSSSSSSPTPAARASDDDNDDDAPPPYSRVGARPDGTASPDAIDAIDAINAIDAIDAIDAADDEKHTPVLHYLDHDRDSVASLSLRYGVSADRLRRANRLAADHLLLARRVIQIPRPSTTAAPLVSLSPRPVESDAETRRKAAIRRFMVACKVADYDLAVLYLEQTLAGAAGDRGLLDTSDHGRAPPAEYDLRAAIAAFQADEQWERAHPVEAAVRRRQTTKKQDANNKSSHAGRSTGTGGFFSRRR